MRKERVRGLLAIFLWAVLGSVAFAQPITVPKETWSWIPFNQAKCANGKSTGLGVNLTDKSKRVLIYFHGGGACWSYQRCYGLLRTAVHITGGYNEAEFYREVEKFSERPFLDRNNARNPFRDYNFVYLPYCTGDIHAGNNVVNYSQGRGRNEIKKTHHVGYKNIAVFLPRITATFPDTKYVLLLGTSAGGCGAWYNWGQVQEAFGSAVRVDVLIDSCPMLRPPYLSEEREQAWRTQWNLHHTLPEDCRDCFRNLDALYDYYATKYPHSRAALVSYHNLDLAVESIFGIRPRQFKRGLDDLVKSRFNKHKNLKYFFVEGWGHVLSDKKMLEIERDRIFFVEWIHQMVDNNPQWTSIPP
jgi:hypothetical protein